MISNHMSVEITAQKYRVLGKNLNIAQAGVGKPLVLIHGWTNNWMGWTLLANFLAPYYRLYMLDLPGFGDSDRLDKYSIDIEAEYINCFIKDFAPSPKAIIGASLGTVIAANTLKNYPHLSNNLIMLGTIFHHLSIKKAANIFKKILEFSQDKNITQEAVAKTVKARITAYLVEMFLNSYKFNKELVDKYNIPGRRKITGKSYIELGLSASKFHMEKYLKETRKNVLLIHGEGDKYVSVKDAEKILVQINNKQLVLNAIEKAGHNIAYEQPKLAAQSIIKFLDKK